MTQRIDKKNPTPKKVSIVLTDRQLDFCHKRAKKLKINRSDYIRSLIEKARNPLG